MELMPLFCRLLQVVDRRRCSASFLGAPARVLLLDANADCSGLSLTVANHVFLLDPVPNEGDLAQLAGRVGRCGRNKPCFVYMIVADGTCEEDAIEALKRVNNLGPAPH